ncbi:hypothetical protein [Tessaracoccus sp.]
MYAHPVDELITVDGVHGQAFDGRDLISPPRDDTLALADGGDWAFDHTVQPLEYCRIRQEAVIDQMIWVVEVWVTVCPSTAERMSQATHTIVISDGINPAAVGFTPYGTGSTRMRKDLLIAVMPGLTTWLRKPAPNAKPPWRTLQNIHEVLTRSGSVLRFAVQAASLGLTDPDLVVILERLDLNPADLLKVANPALFADPVWTEHLIRWLAIFHDALADEVAVSYGPTELNISAGQLEQEWAKQLPHLMEVAAHWSDPTRHGVAPDASMLSWIFSGPHLRDSRSMPLDYVTEARKHGWTSEQAATFFRFHLKLCPACRQFSPWPNTGRRPHQNIPTLTGWAPLLRADQAAACAGAGHTIEEVAAWDQLPSYEVLAVSAALRGVALPTFA